jgi:hypothetical protein
MSRQPDFPFDDLQPDEALVHLEEHIRCRLSGRVRDFHLLVREKGLVLQGHARTYHVKQLAQQAVMEAAHMPIRANEIVVF